MSSSLDYFICECGGRCLQRHISCLSSNFVVKRTRRCEKCGKKYSTIEIDYELYKSGMKKYNDIITIINE